MPPTLTVGNPVTVRGPGGEGGKGGERKSGKSQESPATQTPGREIPRKEAKS